MAKGGQGRHLRRAMRRAALREHDSQGQWSSEVYVGWIHTDLDEIFI